MTAGICAIPLIAKLINTPAGGSRRRSSGPGAGSGWLSRVPAKLGRKMTKKER